MESQLAWDRWRSLPHRCFCRDGWSRFWWCLMILLFLPWSWKLEMGSPKTIRFLYNRVIFHFHDYGRKGKLWIGPFLLFCHAFFLMALILECHRLHYINILRIIRLYVNMSSYTYTEQKCIHTLMKYSAHHSLMDRIHINMFNISFAKDTKQWFHGHQSVLMGSMCNVQKRWW